MYLCIHILKGEKEAIGTVTGVINGIGSCTCALGLWLVTYLQTQIGWRMVWWFLMTCTLTSSVLLTPKVYRELRFGVFNEN